MLAAASVIAGSGGCGGSSVPVGVVDDLLPRPSEPAALRWRDIAGVVYGEAFRSGFSYDADTSYVTVAADDRGRAFRGTLTAVGLKPNFAYQMKLLGRTPITSAEGTADLAEEAWASWQVGHQGRWWCIDDAWNVSDGQLAAHLNQGHRVTGYLLFEFFITDEDGNATVPFSLDSSYHVLWRTDQRGNEPNDSPVLWRDIVRGPYGYGLDPAELGERVGVYAEWEPGRPTPGTVELAAGRYPLLLNLTEESFHDNLGGPPVEHGGVWAQVLEGEVEFEVTG